MSLNTKLGIRREDKNEWERRVPLTPEQVSRLVQQGIQVLVQPSRIRVYPDQAYVRAKATVQEDLSDCPVVLAVKEIPPGLFRPGHAYMCFAHVIKGQPYNMPMLGKLLELGCTLIDYEKVTDDEGKRLIFFGRHAGLAGMTDTLWALGQRLKWEGLDTPFASIQPTHAYENLDQLKQFVRKVAAQLKEQDLPVSLNPMVFGFAGYGNVSSGAQEIFDLLPHQQIQPADLAYVRNEPGLVKVVFKEEHLVRSKDSQSPFQLQEYYDHPELYESIFEQSLPFISVLVNCIYWAPQYPRLVTRKALSDLYAAQNSPRLRVIGDITCDVEGSIECTLKCTEPGDPVFVYQPSDGQILMGVAGKGPVVLAVDNLPSELPRESSHDFGGALMPFVPSIVQADYSLPVEALDLPSPIKRAIVAHGGSLTPDYNYLGKKLSESRGGDR